jgi:hypothetical protein
MDFMSQCLKVADTVVNTFNVISQDEKEN